MIVHGLLLLLTLGSWQRHVRAFSVSREVSPPSTEVIVVGTAGPTSEHVQNKTTEERNSTGTSTETNKFSNGTVTEVTSSTTSNAPVNKIYTTIYRNKSTDVSVVAEPITTSTSLDGVEVRPAATDTEQTASTSNYTVAALTDVTDNLQLSETRNYITYETTKTKTATNFDTTTNIQVTTEHTMTLVESTVSSATTSSVELTTTTQQSKGSSDKSSVTGPTTTTQQSKGSSDKSSVTGPTTTTQQSKGSSDKSSVTGPTTTTQQSKGSSDKSSVTGPTTTTQQSKGSSDKSSVTRPTTTTQQSKGSSDKSSVTRPTTTTQQSKGSSDKSSVTRPTATTQQSKGSSDKSSVTTLGRKTSTLYTVKPAYKRPKKLEIVQPKPYSRDPNDNSWRNESISSLGIVFRPNDAANKTLALVKNRTDVELPAAFADPPPEPELKQRLDKLSSARRAGKRPPEQSVQHDYETDSPAYYYDDVTPGEELRAAAFFREFQALLDAGAVPSPPPSTARPPATPPRPPTTQYFPPSSVKHFRETVEEVRPEPFVPTFEQSPRGPLYAALVRRLPPCEVRCAGGADEPSGAVELSPDYELHYYIPEQEERAAPPPPPHPALFLYPPRALSRDGL